MKTQERPLPMSDMSLVGPLGGADKDPRVPIAYVKDVDDGPPGRH
jgi:hypothetical protein